jgi:cytochrome c biogenesis protein CcdA
MAPIANKGGQMMSRVSGKGLMGQFLVGLLLGLVWSPCVGPTLGVAIAAASQGESLLYSGLTFLVFSLGISTSLLIFAYGSRRVLGTRKRVFQKLALWAKPALGFLLILVGAMILTGYDRVFEAAVVDIMPEWLVGFTTSF